MTINKELCMKTGGFGGAKTLTGLHFERKVDFQQLIGDIAGYEVKTVLGKAGQGVFFEGKLVARCFRKYEFYKFLTESKHAGRFFSSLNV